jgi:FAD/FMN-containing dehydrogenase
VRSGGHSIAGHSTGDDVMVLDVSRLNGLEIDRDERTAWCGPGVQAGPYTVAADAFGLATPFGDHGTVAVGGITLGGGIGWLVRRDGLTIDSLRAVELVTAEGERLVASETEHPDLFWALRGGGGNFGVVTRLKLALHPIDTVLHGTILLRSSEAAILRLLEIAHAAPDELTMMPGVMAIPPMDEVEAGHHGKLGLWIDLLWAGPTDAGLAAISELRSLGPVLFDTVAEKRYPDLFPPPSGNRSAWTSRSLFIDRFDEATIEVIERHAVTAPPGDALAIFRVLGGAASRVAAVATAYPWRDKSVLLWIIADTGSDDATRLPEMAAWATSFRDELRAFGSASYVNFMADEGPEAVAEAYGPATWARLREIKRRYDPDNVFRLNQNIPPAAMRPA